MKKGHKKGVGGQERKRRGGWGGGGVGGNGGGGGGGRRIKTTSIYFSILLKCVSQQMWVSISLYTSV